jgi:RimJ/RimL family protein N-acetyltransferase
MNWQPSLTNDLVILRPLQPGDIDHLFDVASDPLIWEQHPSKERSQRKGFELFFDEALASKGAFVIIDKISGKIIGSTRFSPVMGNKNAIEIGWTFLARKYWGGVYNKAIKKLMMDYAFTLVDHVLFFIHENNFRSQKAVEKIGAERIMQLDNVDLLPRPNASVIYRIHKNQNISRTEKK